MRQQLFARGWTGMEPTSQGEIVIARCRHMMSSIQPPRRRHSRQPALALAISAITWPGTSSARSARSSRPAASRLRPTYLERSQPDISRALAKIAAATGRPPFERTRAGMKATDDAEILADLHTKLLMDVMTLPEQLEALSGKVTGRVAVGLLPFSEQDVVVKVFGEMLSRHRHVRLQAVTGSYAAADRRTAPGRAGFRHRPATQATALRHPRGAPSLRRVLRRRSRAPITAWPRAGAR